MKALHAAYVEAFQRAYPQKTVLLMSQKIAPGLYGTRVLINGDRGSDLLLSDDDLRFAIRMFNQGRNK